MVKPLFYVNKNNKNNKNNKILIFVLLLIFLALFAGLRPLGFDRDSVPYSEMIKSIDVGQFNIEPTFIYISSISKFIANDYAARLTFLVYAILNMTILYFAIKKNSVSLLLSLTIYFFLFYVTLTLTQIRFGISCAIFLYALKDISEKKFIPYIIKIVIATSFHYSAIVLVLFYFISDRDINRYAYFLLLVFSAFISNYSDLLIDLIIGNSSFFPIYIQNKLNNYLVFRDYAEINIVNSFSIISFSIYIFLILNKNVYSSIDIIMIKILGWGLSLYMILSFFPVLSIRVLNLSSLVIIFLFPKIILRFKLSSQYILLMFFLYFLIFVSFNINYLKEMLDFSVFL
jgi:hypothetical protein